MPILHWLTRDEDIRAAARVPYRLLEEASDLSAGDTDANNMLIHGDNLDALKALLPFYAGQVKCIYIDPPYNTRSAFEHYDDNLEHSKWLAMMWPRLELLRELLSEDGSIWVSVDDNEAHYLKVIMDEVFGRKNFVANVFWQKTHTRENRTDVSAVHDHIILFARNREVWKEIRNVLPASKSQLERFTNPDNDPRGPWASLPAHAKAEKGRRKEQFFPVTTPSGRIVNPPPGRCWLYIEDRFVEMINDNRIWFGAKGNNVPRVKKFLSEVQQGLVPSTLWIYQEVGTNGVAKNEIIKLFPGETPFSTAKPERLIQRILHIATNPGDLVLDSFLGSGTTAAVAHKMGRRYIGIEMGEHAVSHCVPRLRKVIEGEQGGISKSVNWQGGGGFRFYCLGPPVFDEDGQIRSDIRFPVLAAHVYFSETGHPWKGTGDSPFLGLHDGRAYALLYNGILGDKRPGGGNVLTRATLAHIREEIAKAHPDADGPLTVYGEQSRLMPQTLEREGIIFKQTPYDVRARMAGPKNAYEAITQEPEQAMRLGGYAGAYVPLKELFDVPYVCLRLPTGGGKTILAAHAVSVARNAWIEKDYPVVLWLVPTNTIRQQTVEALKTARHAYRQVLDEAFDGRVRVFDIADFTHIRPHDIRDHCCIVVGTIQTLRVRSTEGRKVYAHNEEMEPHFSNVLDNAPGLEKLEQGGVKFSFANLLHIHRPLMIVDEAHNAVTGLTREMQARVNPCAIVEFTATPRRRSNILHSVTAQELKREEMIKLPIMLSEHDTWQNAVNGAIAACASLAETASDDADYIRPIVLFQAQPRNQEVTVAALKDHLMEVEQIPEDKIAIATGNQRELDGIDLFDRACPIEYIITVEALKEGWDCSFAYVFCSVSRIQSAKDVEQLLGRVLRMPYAKRRGVADLNKAYAFLSEPSFGEAARGLTDKLVGMGFEEDEALDNIEPVQRAFDDQGDLFGPHQKSEPVFRYRAQATPEVVSRLEEAGQDGLLVRETTEGEVEIAVTGWISQDDEKAICETLPEPHRKEFVDAVAKYRDEFKDQVSPAEQGEKFEVPRLMSVIQGTLEFADTDIFMEYHDWSLLNYSPKMDEDEFMIRETARSFEIDIEGKRVTYQFANEDEQLALDIAVEGWTPEALVLWLDRQVRQVDIHQSELLKWLSELVGHLLKSRGMSISALMRCKFLLANTIAKKINDIRREERDSVYQRYLFTPGSKVSVSFDHAFTFVDGMYQDQRCYRGRWKPRKHFLGSDRVPAFDGVEDGEEAQCAQVIDSLAQVRYWIRNVARHSESFFLPTATDKFYPDFVAQLEDGRLFIIEYKGAHIAEGFDTAHKRTIGARWEQESDGKGLFIIAEKIVDGKDVRQQLMEKIGNV